MSFSYSRLTIVADVIEQQLTTTNSTTIISYTPSQAGGNYRLSVYFRVITAATNVSITTSWTDTAGAQSNTFTLNSLAVGSYQVSEQDINMSISTAITLTVQAGTANQVFVSATLEKKSNG